MCVCHKINFFRRKGAGGQGGGDTVVQRAGTYSRRPRMSRHYGEFHVRGGRLQPPVPTVIEFRRLPGPLGREIALIPSMSRACSPGHLRASQTCYCSFSYGFEPQIPLRRKPRTHLPPRRTTGQTAADDSKPPPHYGEVGARSASAPMTISYAHSS